MLDMGFEPQIRKILEQIRVSRLKNELGISKIPMFDLSAS
jgi:superfamily II DNA/RNA helicase